MEKLKHNLLVVTLVFSTFITAQNVKVVYEITTKVDEKKFEMVPKQAREALIKTLSTPKFYDLTFQNGISLYKKQEETQTEKDAFDELQSESNVTVIKTDEVNSGAYQDFNTREYLEVKGILGKPFFIKDKMVHLDWKLTNEEQKIGNFDCKKATIHYNDKDITAWYTDELPIPIGPDIYNGLPGLVVKLVVGDQTYKAISVEKLTEKITIEKPTFEEKGISRDKFSEIEREKIETLSTQF